jgi:TRAP-type C4-dicarboxylate transport system permease small subunit
VAVHTALCTALVGALCLFVFANVALAYGPAAWVPPNSAALTAAARLEQSRGEDGDTYLWVLLFGVLAATAILVNAIPWRRNAGGSAGTVSIQRQGASEPG